MPSQPQSKSTNRYVVLATLVLVAAVGWGFLLMSRNAAAESEAHLRRQVSSLHQRQMELLDERAQREGVLGTLDKLRSEVATLTRELDSLKEARDQVQADLIRLRAQRDAASDRTRSVEGGMASTLGEGQRADHASIVAAQQTLTKLGYGPLILDGIVGPGTRQAIEDFQDDHGIQVTSELDAATLRQLTASNKAATLE